MAVGTISLAGGGSTYQIKHFRIPQDITMRAQIVGEDLTASGVNGKRVRWIRKAYRPFPALLHISMTSVSNAINAAGTIQTWQQRFVNLSLTFAGRSRAFENVHVQDVNVRIVASETVASDISSETHTLVVRMLLEPTEDVGTGGVTL